MPGYHDKKDAIQKRLRRIEGQVRGLQRMVDEDKYCIDVLDQVAAATKALQAVAIELLDDHLSHCVADALDSGGHDGRREAGRGVRRHRPPGALVTLLAAIDGADVGHSLREAFFMFWETLWALVLGFGLSGAVQAFVSKDQMQRVMGDHRPGTVAKATGFGMVSSSCSYAASAMAKSLFQKGADFTTAMVFMFASTNLVVELGVVLLILMGWQFAAAEFLGGPIMIVLLVVVGRLGVQPAPRRPGPTAARRGHGGRPRPRARWPG